MSGDAFGTGAHGAGPGSLASRPRSSTGHFSIRQQRSPRLAGEGPSPAQAPRALCSRPGRPSSSRDLHTNPGSSHEPRPPAATSAGVTAPSPGRSGSSRSRRRRRRRMAGGDEKRRLLSEGSGGGRCVGKDGQSAEHGREPALELGTRRGQHCHSRGRGAHPGQQQRARRKLYLAAGICLFFMLGEAVGGYLAHSLAILTDAAHLLTDFASIMISLFALWVSSRPPTKTMNFGWHRAEILGALLSVLSIWVVTGVLVYLGAQRLLSGDYDIEGGVMLITSACAVAVNIVMGLALHQTGHGHSHGAGGEQPNASVRAAFVHVLGDLLQSLGVLIASYIIFFKPEYKYVDPICTFLFSALVLGTTLTILRDVLLVLMEGTPKGMDFNAVRDTLLAVRGVEAVHSLHIWALTAAQPLLSVHIAINAAASAQEVLEEASSRLQGAFRFHSTTIQVESYSEEMRDCRECQPPRD
ncbi:proton-coupled zinc antiporter SLC30A2 [Melospiza melodia melodia]|uniref:proton-coupled zinc antiporter SLC30A2 n=1 Tax=Melospiza melodia melodia TaxID=1914991 RepID=UPI002FD35D47